MNVNKFSERFYFTLGKAWYTLVHFRKYLSKVYRNFIDIYRNSNTIKNMNTFYICLISHFKMKNLILWTKSNTL